MKIVSGLLCGLAIVMILVSLLSLLAQPMSTVQATQGMAQSWLIGQDPNNWNDGKVRVYDTPGVCVYTIVGSNYGGITAVSKAILPAGKGC